MLNPTVTVEGRPGHAEMPQPDWREGGAVNAIEKTTVVLEAVRALRERWGERDGDHPLLAPGELVPTVIQGGEWWVNYPGLLHDDRRRHLPTPAGRSRQRR